MNVLIKGGARFIGSQAAEGFSGHHYSVVVLDNLRADYFTAQVSARLPRYTLVAGLKETIQHKVSGQPLKKAQLMSTRVE